MWVQEPENLKLTVVPKSSWPKEAVHFLLTEENRFPLPGDHI